MIEAPDATKRPLSLSDATNLRPMWRDVLLPELRQWVRIRRLPPKVKLSALTLLASLDRDDEGKAKDDDSFEAWIAILSWSVISESGETEFDCREGRDWLASLDISDQLALQHDLVALSGLGKEDRASEIEDAKKN